MKKTALFLLALTWLFPVLSQAWFSSSDAGTSGAAVLKIKTDARGAALGEAITAVAAGLNTAQWNPAGLSALTQPQVGLSHAFWLEDIQLENLAGALPCSFGNFGASATFLSMKPIPKLDNLGNQENSFMPWDLTAALSFARSLALALPWKFKNLSAGLTAKMISSHLDDASATAFAVDAGVLVEIPAYWVRLGLTIENLGTPLKFINEAAPLPFNLKLGAALVWEGLTVAADLQAPGDNELRAGAGVEYVFKINQISISPRAGYKTNSGTRALNGLAGLTAGMGVSFLEYTLDYSWLPMADLGSTHRLSLTYAFEPAPTAATTAAMAAPKTASPHQKLMAPSKTPAKNKRK